LHQGHWARAEKLLLQAAEDERVEAAARTGAAQAALARGDTAAARAHLEGFGERHPASRAIAGAELALRDQRPTDALVALDAPAAQPLPPRGLALRAEALGGSGQAAQAWGLLGPLRKQHAWPEAVLVEREAAWAEASLREADDANALAERWDALPRELRTEPAVVSTYARRAAELGWDDAATGSIEHALDTRWDEGLATRYGQLPVGRIEQRRARAATWLKAHPASPALLLTLARLSRASGDRDQAEDYLHRALAQGGGADAWEALGDGYAESGDEARARQCYANALPAARGDAVTPLPARALPPQNADEAVFEARGAHGVPRLRARNARALPPPAGKEQSSKLAGVSKANPSTGNLPQAHLPTLATWRTSGFALLTPTYATRSLPRKRGGSGAATISPTPARSSARTPHQALRAASPGRRWRPRWSRCPAGRRPGRSSARYARRYRIQAARCAPAAAPVRARRGS